MKCFKTCNSNGKNKKDSKSHYHIIDLGKGESTFERPGKRVYKIGKTGLKKLDTG